MKPMGKQKLFENLIHQTSWIGAKLLLEEDYKVDNTSGWEEIFQVFFFQLHCIYSQGKLVQLRLNKKDFPRKNYRLLISNLYLDRKLYYVKVTI